MKNTFDLPLQFPIQYWLEPDPRSAALPSRGVLVLHGFSDHAFFAKKRILGSEPWPDLTILAPNGLFPAPTRKGDRYLETYSWYFRDPHSGAEMVPPAFAANYLMNLIEGLSLGVEKWIIVGFSQGGFLAPFLVRAGLPVQAIIAVGAAFRPESYEGLSSLRVHAIHGDADDVVSLAQSQESFDRLRPLGLAGQFRVVSGLKHTLNEEGRSWVRSVIRDEFQL